MELSNIDVLDVTVIEPRLKHPTIFSRFDSAGEGEAFIIHNDHDPKPLYYQLLGERGPVFQWEYLEDGPETWLVKITKGAKDEASIGELVAKDYRKAQVFKKFGLDFCCGGKKKLSEACKENGIDVLAVEQELNKIDSIEQKTINRFDSWKPGFLCDYITDNHHAYVKEALPRISQYAYKVARVHGDRHPEVVEIANLFNELANELSLHMRKEEEILFPFVKALEAKGAAAGDANKIIGPVSVMEEEHQIAGDILLKINKLSNNYTPPADSCATYKILFSELEEFETDLHQHIHLENNILFPKALEMGKA